MTSSSNSEPTSESPEPRTELYEQSETPPSQDVDRSRLAAAVLFGLAIVFVAFGLIWQSRQDTPSPPPPLLPTTSLASPPPVVVSGPAGPTGPSGSVVSIPQPEPATTATPTTSTSTTTTTQPTPSTVCVLIICTKG